MLLCQQLGGRHQRHLLAVRDHVERRQRRDQGFTGSDVTLHQTHHREIFGQIALNLLHHAFLRVSRGEGQRRQQFVAQRMARRHRQRVIALRASAYRQHAEVVRQQLFKDQATLRRMAAVLQLAQAQVRRRAMQRVQRLRQTN